MTAFPMFVSLGRRPCLVVGGGRVAARKCRTLLDFGAEVTMVSEETDIHMPERGLCVVKRPFRAADVTDNDWTLVIAATNDREVNGRIAALCHAAGIPVNVADCREECSFFFPACCRQGNVAVGITTSGQSPRLASALRRKLEAVLPEWLEEIGEDGAASGQDKTGR